MRAEEADFSDPDNPPVRTTSKKIKYGCIICGYNAGSAARLKEHLSRHTGEKHLQCQICGKKFAWRNSYRSHMALHSSENPNKCSICNKKFCDKSALKKHVMRLHNTLPKKFKCAECSKDFTTQSELSRHQVNHSNEKPFVCEQCGNSYKFKAALIVHYRIHTDTKPYKCEFCEKSFVHLSSAIGHRRTHTGEKPYQCNVCQKRFRVKRTLTAHMSVHNRSKQFTCKDCGKTFCSRSGFRVHMDFHLGLKRHICKHCGKAFRAWNNMHKHVKLHANDQPTPCKTCNKIFSSKQEMRAHMKDHKNISKKSAKKSCCLDKSDVNEDTGISPLDLGPCIVPMFPNPQHSGSSHIRLQSDVPETNQGMLYSDAIAADKNISSECNIVPVNYSSSFYPTHQPVQTFVEESMNVQNLYSVTETNHLMCDRGTCVSDVDLLDFNNSSVDRQNYDSYSFVLENVDNQLSKCKLCRNVFQTPLDLKDHLLDHHRIDVESIEQFLK